MGKYGSFGTQFQIGNGSLQVETATVIGTITGSGNASFTITAAGMTGSPKTISVPVLIGDTPNIVCQKAVQVIRQDAAVIALFYVSGSDVDFVLTRRAAVANDGTLNIAIANGTCTGLTAAPTSANTVVGGLAEVFTTVGNVTNINGASLALDNEDVTTHDSSGGWEETIPTILRLGEATLDLIFDPNNTTQNDEMGLVFKAENKVLTNCKIIFPSNPLVTWSFPAYVTGFEPSASVDGALTASATLKLGGQPTLV